MQSDFRRMAARHGRRGIPGFLVRLGLGVALVLSLTVSGDAQQSNAAQALGDLQQFLAQQEAARQAAPQNAPAVNPAPAAQTPAQQPAVQAASTAQTQQSTTPPSRLEQIMSQRAGVKLTQFGYDQLGQGREVAVPQAGTVQDNYVLGPGDEIVVTLRGQENSQYTLVVDRNGQITMPRMRPIGASGRTFGSVRQELQAAVHQGYVATDAYVSLGQVRQISVLVSGEVNIPGTRSLSGLSSVVDAIVLSGGIKKTGSLRNVRIERQGRIFTVDLYSVLTDHATTPDLHLADGDRILVPPLGPTVAVTGLVRRPGIFELPPRQSGMAVRSLLDLAGGTEVRGNYRFAILRIRPDGRFEMEPLAGEAGTINDSEILFVQFGADQIAGQATLAGGTGLAGQYAITTGTKLSDFLRAPGALGNTPYTLFGLIVRKDPRTLLRSLEAFTPVAVLNGSEDETLQPGDVVRVFQVDEVQLLSLVVKTYKARREEEAEAIRNPLVASPNENPSNGVNQNGARSGTVGTVGNNANGTQNSIADLAAQNAQNQNLTSQRGDISDILLAQPPSSGATMAQSPAENFQDQDVRAGQYATNREIKSFADLAHQLDFDPLVLANFLMDHQVTIDGAVRGPGDYFVGPNVPLQDLVEAAGGTINWADQSGVELISTSVDAQTGRAETRRLTLPLRQSTLASYVVRPHDSLRFNQVFNDANIGIVTVQGEVRYPGTYSIVRGEHLSDLLSRAGGLTATAYPYGTVFLRKSAAAAEHEGYLRMAKEIEDQLLLTNSQVGSVPVPAAQVENLANQFRTQKALGRVSIVADPSVLASRPDLDPLLEAGDVLYIPQRPSTIAVLGQVMQQGSYRYERGKSVQDYIEEAGGYGQAADDADIFVVLPDGSARKMDVSWLNFDDTALPPGSAIVVPRDLTPFSWRQVLMDSASVLSQISQIAVTTASLAILAKQ